MKKIHLPYLDTDGTLTPHVAQVIADKLATSEINPENPDEIVLTFTKATDANAMLAAIGKAQDAEPKAQEEPVAEVQDEAPAEPDTKA